MTSSQIVFMCALLTLTTLVIPTLANWCAFCRYDKSKGHGAYEYQCVNDTKNYNQTKYLYCWGAVGCKIHTEYDQDYKTILSIVRECGTGYFFGSYCDPKGRARHYCTSICFKDRCNDSPYYEKVEEATTTTTTTTITTTIASISESERQGSNNQGGKTHPFGIHVYSVLLFVIYTCIVVFSNQASYI